MKAGSKRINNGGNIGVSVVTLARQWQLSGISAAFSEGNSRHLASGSPAAGVAMATAKKRLAAAAATNVISWRSNGGSNNDIGNGVWLQCQLMSLGA